VAPGGNPVILNVMPPVQLQSVVAEIDCQVECYVSFLNLKTGELYGNDIELIEYFEREFPDLLESGEKLREIDMSNEWIQLPDPIFRFEDVETIAEYIAACDDPDVRLQLSLAIKDQQSVGRMKAMLHKSGYLDIWNDFRRRKIAKHARNWLRANDIEFEE
jgi:hypothetical protein